MIFRTDMAIERRDIYKKANQIENEIDGIECELIETHKNIKITRVKITSENGEKAIGKPKGEYITLDIKKAKYLIEENLKEYGEIVSKEIEKLVDKYLKKGEGSILIVGLGNSYATADSLGPKVANKIEVTRHIKKYYPQYLKENTRSISAISPGVLGITGIETLEFVKGVTQTIKPDLIIAIDSLCTRNIERISTSIQISDTGIVPGAGVGNKREELSKETLGIPVIAIGVPTVVELATLVSEGIDIFIDILQEKAQSNEFLNRLQETDKYEEVKESLNVDDLNMIVTPKNVDELVLNMTSILERALNLVI